MHTGNPKQTVMFLLKPLVHYSLHFLAPALIAWGIAHTRWSTLDWRSIWGILLATMLIDLDHLLATPVFDPTRCSVGFHPLHSYTAIVVYSCLLLPRRTRIVAVGLLFHIVTDWLDCWI
ncbi:conserved hypothetical protein [Microscilla marina ATCC 23134]|uniref:Transmembrane protein n=2 Tax=Microscilla marina TaxID=1027 RepID=A1ZNF9_MICM2|nr:conserved hypothetical protein [Microscilla marina ATCC 23134]